MIWKAQSSGLRYTATLKPINVFALLATFGFVLLHFVQTHLFYDGLAQDVPEWTAMWSVILLLLVVMLMENRRRGLAFGLPVGGFVETAGMIVRRYHGYYFAWATIYTFWYHPMVFTQGHALGFLYMFLLLVQGSLMFTRAHVNRWWTLTLEGLVVLHGVIVAFYSRWGWQDFPAVFRILGGYFVALPVLALLIAVLRRIAAIGVAGRVAAAGKLITSSGDGRTVAGSTEH